MNTRYAISLRSLVACLLFALWSGCEKEQPLQVGSLHVQTSFRLKSPQAPEGMIAIQEAYLKLDHIQVTGNSGDHNTNMTHAIPSEEPPYQLSRADSGQVTFVLPSRTYDQLDLHLFLYQDDYQLIVTQQPVEAVPDPVEENDGNTDGNSETDQDGSQGNEDDDGDDDAGNAGNDDDKESDENGGVDNDTDDNEDNGNGDGDEAEDNGGNNDDNTEEDNGGNSDDDADEDDEDNSDGDDDEGEDDEYNSGGDDDGNKNKGDKNKNNKDEKKKDKKKKNKGKKNGEHHDDDDEDGRTHSGSDSRVDLDHFFQNAKPAMVVFGTYDNNGQTLHLIMAVTDIEKIYIRAKQNDSYNIVLAEQNLAEITFDASHWFASKDPAEFKSASTQLYQGQQVLFIHKDFNTTLYQALMSRLEESADLNFSTPP